jgi:LCP family protein required for cell wall assembly
MAEPPSQRQFDSLSLRRINNAVAAKQPFVQQYAQPDPAPEAAPLQSPHLRLRRPSKRFTIVASALGSLAIAGSALAFFVVTGLHSKFSTVSLVVSTAKATVAPPTPLAGQDQGRTNFLIYGMTLDGMRTDSIMLASYYYKQKKLVTLNIPRDLYVYDGYENAKFGEVYAYAKLRQPHDRQYPDQFVSNLVSQEYGVPINYWVELNMQGEVDMVNSIGGININVPDSFTDYEYPNWNYNGYVRPAPHFSAGEQHMDGATALIYSRSRHSLDNNEGSDFARSKRQGLVLQSVITKVKSLGVIGNIGQLSNYLKIVNQNVTTSMSTDEMVSAAKLITNLNPSSDHLIANWSTTNGFLCNAVTTQGADIILYGATGACNTQAGGTDESDYTVYNSNSTYRQQAISYVQNLLQSVETPPTPTTSQAAASAATSSTPTSQ